MVRNNYFVDRLMADITQSVVISMWNTDLVVGKQTETVGGCNQNNHFVKFKLAEFER